MGVDVSVPLYEETVEWAGAINSVLLDNPRLLGQAMLMRDKSLMKRRAQLGGIRAVSYTHLTLPTICSV